MASPEVLQKLDIPLADLRLVTAVDPLVIGFNFRDLVNMRYTDTGIKGVSGMTQINTTALTTYVTIREGFHFKKDRPAESHVIVQVFNGTGSSRLYQNTAVVPAQGDFSSTVLYDEGANTAIGRFSKAPDNAMIYCNPDIGTFIWTGDEAPIATFINFSDDGIINKDYTEAIRNINTSGTDSIAVLTRAQVNTPKLLLHLNEAAGAFIDSSTGAHVINNVGVASSASPVKFGANCGHWVAAATDYLWIANHTDFDFSGGEFTIDFWYRAGTTTLGYEGTIYFHRTHLYRRAFTLGQAVAPVPGDLLTGSVSGNTATLVKIEITSGSFATNDAAGTIYCRDQNAAMVAENLAYGGAGGQVTIAGDLIGGGDNYEKIRVYWDGNPTSNPFFQFTIHEGYGSGTDLISLTGEFSSALFNTWIHVQVAEHGDYYYIYVNGTCVASSQSEVRPSTHYSGDLVYIGIDVSGTKLPIGAPTINNPLRGYIDEFRILKNDMGYGINNFTPPTTEYSDSYKISALVGSPIPANGFKIYMGTVVNASAAVMAVSFYSLVIGWAPVATFSDGTATAGKSLAKTGSVTFTKVGTEHPIVTNGLLLYWYKIDIPSCDNNVEITRLNIIAPFQAITDIWDGIERECLSFIINDGSLYKDATLNVFKNEYVSSDTGTFVELDGLTGAGEIYFGLEAHSCAIMLNLVTGKANTTAGTTAALYQWNGAAWAAVWNLIDGTSVNGVSLAQSGIMSWAPLGDGEEFKTEIQPNISLFYYKLKFDQTLSADVQLYYAAGIPSPKKIGKYNMPVLAMDRAWLIGERDKDKNKIICSDIDTPYVWNGSGTQEILIGDESECVGGAPVFINLDSGLIEALLVFKKDSTWMISRNSDGSFSRNLISNSVGCIAPGTIKSTTLNMGDQGHREVVIWQANDGIYIFAGIAPIRISQDINDCFEQENTTVAVKQSLADKGHAFIDTNNREYHWLYPAGSSATNINRELCYDLERRKWFEVVRNVDLLSGFSVQDTVGNVYEYGCSGAGRMYRLENGKAFDTNAISQYFQTGDFAMVDFLEYAVERIIKLIMKSGASAAISVVLSYFKDTSSTAEFVSTVNGVAASSNRISNIRQQTGKGPAVYHGIKALVSSSTETFEPLKLGLFFQPSRPDTFSGKD